MKFNVLFLLLIALVVRLELHRKDRVAPIAVEDFDRLLVEIKPQPNESTWRQIPWLTNITEARQRAVAEDKPLVIFTAADGSPLCRT